MEGIRRCSPSFYFTSTASLSSLAAAAAAAAGQDFDVLCNEGQLDKAVAALVGMPDAPSNHMYWSLLKACNKKKSLTHARQVHKHLTRSRLSVPCSLSDYLVTTLARCGGLEEAHNLFFSLQFRTVISWTAMMSCYVDSGQACKALKMFPSMLADGVEPDERTFVGLLKACSSIADLDAAKQLHADARSKGFVSDVFVGSTLISTYGKCGSIIEAENVFEHLVQRNVVSWSAMLTAYVECDQAWKALQLFRQMKEEGESPDDTTLLVVLQACGFLIDDENGNASKCQLTTKMLFDITQALHGYALKRNSALYISVCNILVTVYGKCERMLEAEDVFRRMVRSDVVSWSAMLSAYAEQGQEKKALQLYYQMHREGIEPDQQAFAIAVQACLDCFENGGIDLDRKPVKVICLDIVQALHADAEKKDLTCDTYLGCSLMSMYGKCGSVMEAESVFNDLYKRDVISWSALLSVYIEQGQPHKALLLYRQMQHENVKPDHLMFVVALQACIALVDNDDFVLLVDKQSTTLMSLDVGRALHAYARRKGFISDVYVRNSLITMYGKCGSIFEAENVFVRSLPHDVVSWNAILSAYVELEQAEKALELYEWMQEEFGTLNDVTLVCILQACSETANMEVSRETHFIIICFGYDGSSALANILIHAYGACASLPDALAVFYGVLDPNFKAWSTLITSYSREGNCPKSLQVFGEMQLVGLSPDQITFFSLLSACSHAGLIDKGAAYFESMSKDYGIIPESKHYAIMIDLFGRAGGFKEVEGLLLEMPTHEDLGVWLSLLSVCCTHGNVELGRSAFDEAVHVKPKEAALYVLMSNIYSGAGLDACSEDVLRQKENAWTLDKVEENLLVNTFNTVNDSKCHVF